MKRHAFWPATAFEIADNPDPHLERLAGLARAAVRSELLWLQRVNPSINDRMLDHLTHQALDKAAIHARARLMGKCEDDGQESD